VAHGESGGDRALDRAEALAEDLAQEIGGGEAGPFESTGSSMLPDSVLPGSSFAPSGEPAGCARAHSYSCLLSSSTALDFCGGPTILVHRSTLTEFDIIAREVSGYPTRFEAIEKRLDEVEQVNARLESAALTTSRATAEISKHWDAVYEAMRRTEEQPAS